MGGNRISPDVSRQRFHTRKCEYVETHDHRLVLRAIEHVHLARCLAADRRRPRRPEHQRHLAKPHAPLQGRDDPDTINVYLHLAAPEHKVPVVLLPVRDDIL